MDTPARRSHLTGSCGPLCRRRRSHHPGSRPGPRTDEFRPLSPPGQTVAWAPNWRRFGTKLSHLHSTGGVIGSKLSHGGGPPGVPSIRVEVFPTELETSAIGVEAYPTDVERSPTGAGMLATGAGMSARKLSHAGDAEETVACTFAPTVYRATVVEAFSTVVEAFPIVVEAFSTIVETYPTVVETFSTAVEARRLTWSRSPPAWSRARRNCRTSFCRPRGTTFPLESGTPPAVPGTPPREPGTPPVVPGTPPRESGTPPVVRRSASRRRPAPCVRRPRPPSPRFRPPPGAVPASRPGDPRRLLVSLPVLGRRVLYLVIRYAR